MPENNAPVQHIAGTEAGKYNTMLFLRLIVSSLIFASSLIFGSLPSVLRMLLQIVCAGIAGYDIALDAFSYVRDRDFFAVPVIITGVAVLSCVIGFPVEAVALVILYQIGLCLLSYAEERSRKSAIDLLQYHDEGTIQKMTELVCRDGAGDMAIEASMRYSAGSVLKLSVGFAVIYAIGLPLITNYSYVVSIHRALMIILIASPMSVVISMPITGIIGMCYSARHGVIFNNAACMETVAEAGIAVFDNTGIVSQDMPRLTGVDPERIDAVTFLSFAAHALYYSEQPVAKAVATAYTKEYRLNIVENFTDIVGYGVEADIGGAHVILANRELFSGRGVELPERENDPSAFYMMISGYYVGKLSIHAEFNPEATELVIGMREAGINRCILLTEHGNFESRRIAEEMDFRESYGECDGEKKLRLVEDLKTSSRKPIVYIYQKSTDSHSAADVDIRVSRRGKFADVIVFPEYLANLPFAVQVCKRVREIAIENALFAFIIKAILIFLSIIGYCNIWFAIFVDMVAAIATVLNAIRVTSESLINILLYKTGQR